MASRGKNKKKKDHKVLIILITILVTVGMVLALLYFLGIIGHQNENKTQKDLEAKLGQLPNKTPEEIEKVLNQVVEEGMFNVSINTHIINVDGKANVGIENIPGNHYLMQVDIHLQEDDKLVYSSGYIEPGYYIDEAEFTEKMEKGVHHAVAIFTALDPETEEIEGQTSVEIEIEVS